MVWMPHFTPCFAAVVRMWLMTFRNSGSCRSCSGFIPSESDRSDGPI